MHLFSYKKGKLFCEGVPVETLAKEYGTPLYVYSRKTIEGHYQRLDQALAPLDHRICYAVKANSNLAILSTLARLKSGFDVVSMGELHRVVAAGGNPARCVFAGVGKSEIEIREALRLGIGCFNVESEPELNRIHQIARSMKRRAPVSLRVNPNVEAGAHAKITTGTYENKFGIAFEEVEGLYDQISRMPWIQSKGIQIHIGSQIVTATPFSKAIRKMLPLVSRLRDRYHLEFFSIGGGIGIVYRPALESGKPGWWQSRGQKKADGFGKPLTIDLYARTLVPLLRPLKMKILLEPGRFIVGNAGILVARVEYLKRTGRKNFMIVNAAMNDLIRPAFYDSYHEIVPLVENFFEPRLKSTAAKFDVVGPVCESGDYFAKDRPMPHLHEGDYLALMSAGAYGFAMASNYNTRPRPPEILVSGQSARVARRRETFQDLIRGESHDPR